MNNTINKNIIEGITSVNNTLKKINNSDKLYNTLEKINTTLINNGFNSYIDNDNIKLNFMIKYTLSDTIEIVRPILNTVNFRFNYDILNYINITKIDDFNSMITIKKPM